MPETPETTAPEHPAGPIAAHYKGNGDFFGGIPARDLDLAEWRADLTPGQRELCVTSGLYEATSDGLEDLPDSPILADVKAGKPFARPEPEPEPGPAE